MSLRGPLALLAITAPAMPWAGLPPQIISAGFAVPLFPLFHVKQWPVT